MICTFNQPEKIAIFHPFEIIAKKLHFQKFPAMLTIFLRQRRRGGSKEHLEESGNSKNQIDFRALPEHYEDLF